MSRPIGRFTRVSLIHLPIDKAILCEFLSRQVENASGYGQVTEILIVRRTFGTRVGTGLFVRCHDDGWLSSAAAAAVSSSSGCARIVKHGCDHFDHSSVCRYAKIK